jgi:hypothetical protein
MKTGLAMKQVMLVALGTSMVAGCGGQESEDIVRVSSALVRWTGWISEETPPNQGVCDLDDAQAATRAACRGSFCDDMRLFCGTLPQGFVSRHQFPVWTGYVSEEQPDGVFCPPNSIVYGIRATGSFSDNVSIRCVPADFPAQGVNCAWSPWFSEEQGDFGQSWDVSTQSYAWAVATGVRCSGSYCDNMSYFICEPKCRTNADCFSACNANGVCVVG